MRKAVVVTERGRLLAGLLRTLSGRELELVLESSLVAGARRRATERADLLLVDIGALADAERAQLPALRLLAGEDCAVVVVVPADRPRLMREALRAAPDGILLDPFDLADGARLLSRLAAARAATPVGQETLDGLATFLKGLAHEVNNPLMGVSGILQLLRKDPSAPPELLARYEAMWQGAERIQQIVRDLEHFVRTRKPQRASLDLVRLLREQSEKWKSGKPPLLVSATLPEHAPSLLGDGEQLAAALRALARFAAGSEGTGAIAVTLLPADDRLEVEIMGSAPLKLPTRPHDLLIPYQDAFGTGRSGSLDLASAWGIVRGHHGSLDVDAAPSGGVRFRVLLPAAPPPPSDG
jgi:signal transduction histidine kinase